MKVMLADVEAPRLTSATADLRDKGLDVSSLVVDVSDPRAVDHLRDVTLEAYGGVHVLCNNAGVSSSMDDLWTVPQREWDWVLGVNFWGVVHGVRSFVPAMLLEDEAYIVNTASIFGLLAGSMGPYSVSKHAVVALTENLFFQMQERHPHVGVSVLCPGAVRTLIATSDRNRPGGASGDATPDPAAEDLNRLLQSGLEPEDVATLVVEAIAARRFYIKTSSNRDATIQRRAEEMIAGRGPTHPLRPPERAPVDGQD